MGWSSVTSAVGTWGSAVTATEVGWQQLSAVTENDGTGIAFGVDFRLKVDDQHPWQINDSRPVQIIDDMETP